MAITRKEVQSYLDDVKRAVNEHRYTVSPRDKNEQLFRDYVFTEKKREEYKRKFGIGDFSVPFTETTLFTEGRKWIYASYIELYGLEKLEEMCKWNPQILISTIHHVKGSEAKNVAVMLDATRKTRGNVYNDIDEELRVLYVGITRTRENLYLIDSKNGEGYDNIIQTVKNQYGMEF